MKYSDNNKPQLDLLQLIPNVFRSDINETLMTSVFNKMFTKDDVQNKAGNIGFQGTDNIIETSAFRQAYQLTPSMYLNYNGVESSLSWDTFLYKVQSLGIDVNKLNIWGATELFNWAPPINLDKFINYRDYVWNDNSIQQYFTIENGCNISSGKIASYKRMIKNKGKQSSAIINQNNTFIVDGDLTNQYLVGEILYTISNQYEQLNNLELVIYNTFYNISNDNTVILTNTILYSNITPPINPETGNIYYNSGTLEYYEWNGISWILISELTGMIVSQPIIPTTKNSNNILIVDNDWSEIFTHNFIFSISSISTNYQLDITCVSSSYDQTTNQTTINIFENVISTATDLTLKITTMLQQYLLDNITTCNNPTLNNWTSQNKWLHKNNIINSSNLVSAQLPILEFSPTVELSNWDTIHYNWLYRKDATVPFGKSSIGPNVTELLSISHFKSALVFGVYYLYIYGDGIPLNLDLTSIYSPYSIITIKNDLGILEAHVVVKSSYRQLSIVDHANFGESVTTVGNYFVTVIELQDYFNVSNTQSSIVPNNTTFGDNWLGYHVHWVLNSYDSLPSSNQQINQSLLNDYASTPFISSTYVKYTSTYQLNEVDSSIILTQDTTPTIITLLPVFQFPTSKTFATANGDLRVYVNDVRQYSNYEEIITQSSTIYPTIVEDVNNTINDNLVLVSWVSSIQFNLGVLFNLGDIIRIEVVPACLLDTGLSCIPVRTIKNDVEFLTAVQNNTQPVYESICRYKKHEQLKLEINQYPSFNTYDIRTNLVARSTPIISYEESVDSNINQFTQTKIISTGTNDYSFKQHLVDYDNSSMYCYRDTSLVDSSLFWVNPQNNEGLYWNGSTYSSKYVNIISGLYILNEIVVSTDEPIHLEGNIWINPITLVVKISVSSSWNPVYIPVIVNEIDPTLSTIWNYGVNYSPRYVNELKQEVTIGTTPGGWEPATQWTNNIEHDNKQIIKFNEIYSHFSSILNEQLIGYGWKDYYNLTQKQFQFGFGGIIKEHNYSFDTFVSVINNDVNLVNLIKFAEQEYFSCLKKINTIFDDHIVDLLINDLDIPSSIISLYETNIQNINLYSDSSSYNITQQIGIKNWIATLPILGIVEPTVPSIIKNLDNIICRHHDGHLSSYSLSSGEYDTQSNKVIATIGTILGKKSSLSYPISINQYFDEYGHAIMNNSFWYNADDGLYQLKLYSITPNIPSMYNNGVELVDGTMYYNTFDNLLYSKLGSNWILVTGIANDITFAWKLVDFISILGDVLLAVESKLYDVSLLSPNKILTVLDSHLTQLMNDRFNVFANDSNVLAPLSNVSYSQYDSFSWNYKNCIINTIPVTGKLIKIQSDWKAIYQYWYNTPFPQLEPWLLQGYTDKPSWWDIEYKETNGSRTWKYDHTTQIGMWSNILLGIVPFGYTLPLVSVPTYNYLPINITNTVINGGYQSDSLLPPYYDNSSLSIPDRVIVRSLFTLYSQIISPDVDYLFGDNGPFEWVWRNGIAYNYDKLISTILYSPLQTISNIFGNNLVSTNQLQVDLASGKVPSHKNIIFHDSNNQINGINQWYVNHSRFSGYDHLTTLPKWTNWEPRLSYRMNNIIDSNSLQITHDNIDITNLDYTLLLNDIGPIKDIWLDAFNIVVLNVPPAHIRNNTQSKWLFELHSLSQTSRLINYYDVKSFQFSTMNNIVYINEFKIVQVSSTGFSITGDYTEVFKYNPNIFVSQNIIGSYKYEFVVISSSYDAVNDLTQITVNTPTTNINTNFNITLQSYVNDWFTGDMVVFSSSQLLPYPLTPNNPYYIIRDPLLNDNSCRIAETYKDSMLGNYINITSAGHGEHQIFEIVSSFNALGGIGISQETWYHCALDKTKIKQLYTPSKIKGVQHLINIIDGVSELYIDSGFIMGGSESSDFDPTYGNLITWSFELERFIDWIYGIRESRLQIADRYDITVNVTDNVINFVDMIPTWANNQPILFKSSIALPTPIFEGQTYFLTKASTGYYVSTTKNNLNPVILMNGGLGNVYVTTKPNIAKLPTFELNPFRNNIWINTPQGILSNVIEPNNIDVNRSQTIYDQYGRLLTPDKINVHRQDQKSRISIVPKLHDNREQFLYYEDPYNYIHFGGCHLFVNGYEHVICLNNHISSNNLIFSSFLGLNVDTLKVSLIESTKANLYRPTIGGYFIENQKNVRNIDGTATDLTLAYDTYSGDNNSIFNTLAKDLIGFNKQQTSLYLGENQNITNFQFYKGMINHKGSNNCITAFSNNLELSSLIVDEYWAYKLADFGSNVTPKYPTIKLLSTDSIVDNIKFNIVSDPDYNILAKSFVEDFIVVDKKDQARWINFPDLVDFNLPSNVSTKVTIFSNSFPPPITINDIDYWYDSEQHKLYNKSSSGWNIEVPDTIVRTPVYVYWVHDQCDLVSLVKQTPNESPSVYDIISSDGITLQIHRDVTNDLYSGKPIQIINFLGYLDTPNKHIVSSSIYNNVTGNTEILLQGSYDYHYGTILVTSINFFNTQTEVLTNHIDYADINSRLTRLPANNFSQIITQYTFIPDVNTLSSIEVLDDKSNLISKIPDWHPAIGIHHSDIGYVNVINANNPAKYNYTINPNNESNSAWNIHEVGTLWLNSTYLNYIPYYDHRLDTINNRISEWGNFSDYGTVKLYEWIKSPVPPASYSNLVIAQSINDSIPIQDKVTGNAKSTLFFNNREIFNATLNYPSSTITLSDGSIDVDESFVISSIIFPSPISQYDILYAKGTSNNLISFNFTDSIGNLITLNNITNTCTIIPIELGLNPSSISTFSLLYGHRIQVASEAFQEGDVVKFSTSGTLPNGLSLLESYKIHNIDYDLTSKLQTFDLLHMDNSGVIIATLEVDTVKSSISGVQISQYNIGSGTMNMNLISRNIKVAPTFKSTNWQTYECIVHSAPSVLLVNNPLPKLNPTLHWIDNAQWIDGESAEIYVNGKFKELTTVTVIGDQISTTLLNNTIITDIDLIDIVRHMDVNSSFDPTVNDNGTETTWWRTDYEYTQETSYSTNGKLSLNYYFWVEQNTKTSNIANNLKYDANPYFIMMDPTNMSTTTPLTYYSKLVLGNIGDLEIHQDYQIKLILDNSLQDDTTLFNTQVSHQEWKLIRKKQLHKIDKVLWDKLTEALAGREINSLNLVPSLNRVLFDQVNISYTRFGLTEGKAFCDKKLGLYTLSNYLSKLPELSFIVKLDTPSNIISLMNYLYDELSNTQINDIWFSILLDALSTNKKYSGIMKTSYLSASYDQLI